MYETVLSGILRPMRANQQSIAKRLFAATTLLTASSLAHAQFVGTIIQGATSATSSSIPPDTMGAVGIDTFVQPLNGRYTVYRKSDGVSLATTTLTAEWQGLGLTLSGNRAFDPRVVYDPNSRRYIMAALDGLSSAGNNAFLIAASNTPDPTGTFTTLRVPVNASLFADFDMLGLSGTHVSLGANMFVPSGSSSKTAIYSIPKSSLFAGNTTNAGMFSSIDPNTTGYSIQPAFDYNGTTGVHHVFSAYSSGTVAITPVITTGSTPTLGTTVYNNVASYSTQPKARQPSAVTFGLDSGDTRFSSNVIRVGNNYWAVHGIAGSLGGNTAMRWYRFDATTLSLAESGTIENANFDYIYASIAVNPRGDVVLGFTRTGTNSPAGFPSAAVMTGTFNGSTTTFGATTILRAGAATYFQDFGSGRNRWGDYSATMLDPTDPQIFWTSQEYSASSNTWGVVHAEIITPAPGEKRWSNAASGAYSTATNYLGSIAPSPSDVVVFSRATTAGAAAYTVAFTGTTLAQRFSIRQGNVAFDLGASGVVSLLSNTPAGSLVVGEFGGSPTLTFTGGTLSTVTATVAPSAVSDGTLILSGTTWTSTGNVALGSTNSPAGTASGPIGTATLRIQAGSTSTFAGTLTVNPNASVSVAGSGSRIVTTTLVNAGRATLATGTTASLGTVTNTGTLSFAGTIQTGPLTNSAQLSVTGVTTLASLTGTGTTTVSGSLTAPYLTQRSLVVSTSGSVTLTGTPTQLSVLDNLSIANNGAPLGVRTYSGALNLTDRDLIVHNGSLANLRDAVRASLTPAGGGLGTSLASTITTLAVFPNQAAPGVPFYSAYDGLLLVPTDVLIKYTYIGDTNVDGILNGADLANILEGLSAGLTGWQNGDTNYDGLVNATDVTNYLTALAGYTDPLGPSGTGANAGIPEPTAILLTLPALATLTTRRPRLKRRV